MMPTENENSSNVLTSLDTTEIQHMEPNNIDKERHEEMSASATNGHNDCGSGNTGSSRKTSITSPDPTAYVAKARITRPTPPPPSYNPMQFVQIKPCNLYQTAQQQLKKVEEVKKIKEIKKEEPEDWQNNLDNWKSSRRKRVEHIIDRVVEVKKLELEEYDRSRRKSKTFSEMMEERGERGVRVGLTKLASLTVYNEDETNDLSDLGIGTSSASGKSSLSDDYDNNSVVSDNTDLEKALLNNSHHPQNSTIREYVSSPGYDTSSSTAPTSSPDPCEYTYEGAIQDYKQRVSKATSGGSTAFKLINNKNQTKTTSKESTPEMHADELSSFDLYPARRGSKIEERLIGFEVNSSSDSQDLIEKNKIDVPKIDISKRKEIFELNQMTTTNSNSEQKLHGICNGVPKKTLRDHFKLNESAVVKTNSETKRLSGDMTSIRERLLSLEQQKNPIVNNTNDVSKSVTSSAIDVPVLPLKERLSSLQNAATKEDVKKSPVVLVDARQLEIMKDEEERNAKQRIKQMGFGTNAKKIATTTITTPTSTESLHTSNQIESLTDENVVADSKPIEADRDDSGIQTSDDVEEERNNYKQLQQQPNQEQQLNEAIAALAMEEKQLEQAANVVNQIEAEFEEFSNVASLKATPAASSSSTNNEQPCEIMEVSVSPTNDSINKYSNVCSGSVDNCIDNLAGRFDLDNKKINVFIDNEVSGKINETTGSSMSAGVDCNLNRKPSNEMIHARNLLNMFKETFKNDFEDESNTNHIPTSKDSNFEFDSKTIYNVRPPQINPELSSTEPTLETTSQHCRTLTKTYEENCNKLIKKDTPKYFGLPPPITRPKPILNPKTVASCAVGPTGKPPMSPKSARSSRHPLPSPPTPSAPPTPPKPSSPSSPLMTSRDGNITPKPENPFSINGRVEIFNSKSAQIESDSSLKPSSKPLSPIAVTKRSNISQLGQVNTNKTQPEQKCSNDSNWIQLQHQRQTLKSNTEAWNNSSHKPAMSPIHKTETIQTPPQVLQLTQSQHQTQTEIIVCTPPVTIINPDELPKPNTVKALKSCFTSSDDRNDVISPKPMRRKQIVPSPSQTENDQKEKIDNLPKNPSSTCVIGKELSPLTSPRSSSSTSSTSSDPNALHETKALIHNPPKSPSISVSDSRDEISFQPSTPSIIPPLVLCSPNESTLYKLASSAPQSPCTPTTPLQKLSPTAVDLCTSFFSQIASPPASSVVARTPPSFNRQHTVEEIMCDKIDVRKVPNNQLPGTGCYDITIAQIENCDSQNNLQTALALNTSGPEKKINSKPNSPIVAARAAHSKALIETCEKIIAEERQARSQISASLPRTSTSPKYPSMAGCKSKIPIPGTCCISASDSITTADLEADEHQKDEKRLGSPEAIGRQHVVETQIKVVTKTPPASPKMSNRKHRNNNDNNNKNSNNNNSNSKTKTKNIFDFLRKNFSHSESAGPVSKSSELPGNAGAGTKAVQDGGDILKKDKIITVDNSKFYIACEEEEETTPPPLPQSPVLTGNLADEILEETPIDFSLKEEINALLDEEINKLNLETKIHESGDKLKTKHNHDNQSSK